MTVLAQLGQELNGWVTAVGGVAVILAISVIMQKWHERQLRKLATEQNKLLAENNRLQKLNLNVQEQLHIELRILNAVMAKGGRK